jgi:DNA-binding XRE family transcriptional regulator
VSGACGGQLLTARPQARAGEPGLRGPAATSRLRWYFPPPARGPAAYAGRGLRRPDEGEAVAEPPVRFAGMLRQLRAGAALTQEELAEAAGLNPRTVSDLERGLATTPHKDTVRLLADALQLGG